MKRLSNRRSAGKTLVDLLVVAVLIPLVLVLVAGCWRTRSRGAHPRVQCASNLRQIGQAILLYSNENRGAYPRTTHAPGSTLTPTWGTGALASEAPAPNDVSAALFLLLRTQEITPEVFTCPNSDAERWDFGLEPNAMQKWSNWNGRDGIRKHLSYSYQNPYPDDGAVERKFVLDNSISAEFAVAADINPGTGGADFNVLLVTPTASAKDMSRGNSRNHDRDGQNVLYGDGHVEFQSNPFCGVNRDMIYARRAGASGWASSAVRASPYDANDSVLLPADE